VNFVTTHSIAISSLFVILSLQLSAQSQTSLHGRVLDPTSSRIAGAQISAVPDGGTTPNRTAVSDANGEFTLLLSVGKYTLQISKQNFVTAARSVELSSRLQSFLTSCCK
jgi:hypothetical protein